MHTARERTAKVARILGLAGALALLCGSSGQPARAALRLVPEVYPTIQAAVNAAVVGDTVLLSPGTYRGASNRNIGFLGKDLVVTSREGADQTIIDCEQAGRGFRIHQWESRDARIERLTIMNGSIAGEGGGISCDIASPTISECRILNCAADGGGGLFLAVFGGIVDRCVIAGNRSTDSGGGIMSEFSGGAYDVTNCVITGNRANNDGGGVAFAEDSGGNALRNCTVTANSAGDVGGGIITSMGIVIDRCIVQGNCASRGEQLFAVFETTSLLCSEMDSSGVDVDFASISYDEHCVFTDPMFCAAVPCGQTTAGDWTLSESSPCLPSYSPCGQLIGALDAGCGVAFPPGACCLVGGACVVVSEYACSAQQGLYRGNGTLCQPDPCGPTPIERTSWGRIKAAYR
jgi:parallel beta-helix repeat protein